MDKIAISSNYKRDGQYVMGGNSIRFDRIYAGISGNTAVILGEENFHGVVNMYLLADVICGTFNEMLKVLGNIQRVNIDDFFWRANRDDDQILHRHQVEAFRNRRKQLYFNEAPGEGDNIKPQVEAVMMSLKPKHLYLFGESRVPAALQSLPSDYSKLKAMDHQLVAALGYCVTAMVDIQLVDRSSVSLTSRSYAR